jgi:hypothetical protein
MEKDIYEYLEDLGDLFEFKVKFIQDENELLVALPTWMTNIAGNIIADFIEIEFYKRKRTEDYIGTHRNMTLTIQCMEDGSYYVVVDFAFVAGSTTAGTALTEGEDPK